MERMSWPISIAGWATAAASQSSRSPPCTVLPSYALITGLGVDYVDRIVANLPTKNYLAEPPPTPPPEPQPKDTATTDQQVINAPQPKFRLPDPSDTMRVPQIPDIPAPPMPNPTFDPGPPPLPKASPSFTPASAKPANDPGGWVSANDYPTRDIRHGNEGTARFQLTIGASGKVTGCTITQSSNHSDLDEATCRYVLRRAKFEPATDGAGKRVPGKYSGSIRWVIPQ